MVHKHTTILEAYTALGLEQGSSLEAVKSSYKQLALKTHPDKNPGNKDATVQFQQISEAYNVLVKHLDKSSGPYGGHMSSYGYDDYDEDDEDKDGDENDYYYYNDEELHFYRFLFEEMMSGRAYRNASSRFQQQRNHHHPHVSTTPPETAEQYQARIRRAREEQEAAEVRRLHEEAARKVEAERERDRERKDAERRQKEKASNKKVQAAASRQAAEQKARALVERTQHLRSAVFAAARRKDVANVKKGVYEDAVDASGGEVKKGAEAFVKCPPRDPRETLLHIAVNNGDVDLVAWLDSHGADPEERNSQELTAFHVALQAGHKEIMDHFFDLYPSDDPDHAKIYERPPTKSLAQLALDSGEPEIMWIILQRKMTSKAEIDAVWNFLCSDAANLKNEAYSEIMTILQELGGCTPPKVEEHHPATNGQHQHSKSKNQQSPPRSTSSSSALSSSLGSKNSSVPQQHSVRKTQPTRPTQTARGRPSHPPASQPSSTYANDTLPKTDNQPRPPNLDFRGRGRGRGSGRSRGHGRGRGGRTPAAAA